MGVGLGALDRSAGIAAACGAEVVVFHPGFLLGRSREDAIAAVVDQLGMVRERLEGKGRAVPFGVEVMGACAISARSRTASRSAAAPAGSGRARLRTCTRRATARTSSRSRSGRRSSSSSSPAPFHVHFSDIAFANRNETKHLPYGEGTLRADPLREALRDFARPATVISESPDEESSR